MITGNRARKIRTRRTCRGEVVESLEGRLLLSISFGPEPAVYNVGGGPIAVGDFNSDGKPDLAVVDIPQSGTGGTVSVLLNPVRDRLARPRVCSWAWRM
jgi:hypothetical protein